ncbi:unnamed protein product [Amoebophrya sp. A25]|nr:unnamed protein product [Amoebophrya sp. A25]|eukprot:GSA25T00016645001.1
MPRQVYPTGSGGQADVAFLKKVRGHMQNVGGASSPQLSSQSAGPSKASSSSPAQRKNAKGKEANKRSRSAMVQRDSFTCSSREGAIKRVIVHKYMAHRVSHRTGRDDEYVVGFAVVETSNTKNSSTFPSPTKKEFSVVLECRSSIWEHSIPNIAQAMKTRASLSDLRDKVDMTNVKTRKTGGRNGDSIPVGAVLGLPIMSRTLWVSEDPRHVEETSRNQISRERLPSGQERRRNRGDRDSVATILQDGAARAGRDSTATILPASYLGVTGSPGTPLSSPNGSSSQVYAGTGTSSSRTQVQLAAGGAQTIFKDSGSGSDKESSGSTSGSSPSSVSERSQNESPAPPPAADAFPEQRTLSYELTASNLAQVSASAEDLYGMADHQRSEDDHRLDTITGNNVIDTSLDIDEVSLQAGKGDASATKSPHNRSMDFPGEEEQRSDPPSPTSKKVSASFARRSSTKTEDDEDGDTARRRQNSQASSSPRDGQDSPRSLFLGEKASEHNSGKGGQQDGHEDESDEQESASSSRSSQYFERMQQPPVAYSNKDPRTRSSSNIRCARRQRGESTDFSTSKRTEEAQAGMDIGQEQGEDESDLLPSFRTRGSTARRQSLLARTEASDLLTGRPVFQCLGTVASAAKKSIVAASYFRLSDATTSSPQAASGNNNRGFRRTSESTTSATTVRKTILTDSTSTWVGSSPRRLSEIPEYYAEVRQARKERVEQRKNAQPLVFDKRGRLLLVSKDVSTQGEQVKRVDALRSMPDGDRKLAREELHRMHQDLRRQLFRRLGEIGLSQPAMAAVATTTGRRTQSASPKRDGGDKHDFGVARLFAKREEDRRQATARSASPSFPDSKSRKSKMYSIVFRATRLRAAASGKTMPALTGAGTSTDSTKRNPSPTTFSQRKEVKDVAITLSTAIEENNAMRKRARALSADALLSRVVARHDISRLPLAGAEQMLQQENSQRGSADEEGKTYEHAGIFVVSSTPRHSFRSSCKLHDDPSLHLLGSGNPPTSTLSQKKREPSYLPKMYKTSGYIARSRWQAMRSAISANHEARVRLGAGLAAQEQTQGASPAEAVLDSTSGKPSFSVVNKKDDAAASSEQRGMKFKSTGAVGTRTTNSKDTTTRAQSSAMVAVENNDSQRSKLGGFHYMDNFNQVVRATMVKQSLDVHSPRHCKLSAKSVCLQLSGRDPVAQVDVNATIRNSTNVKPRRSAPAPQGAALTSPGARTPRDFDTTADENYAAFADEQTAARKRKDHREGLKTLIRSKVSQSPLRRPMSGAGALASPGPAFSPARPQASSADVSPHTSSIAGDSRLLRPRSPSPTCTLFSSPGHVGGERDRPLSPPRSEMIPVLVAPATLNKKKEMLTPAFASRGGETSTSVSVIRLDGNISASGEAWMNSVGFAPPKRNVGTEAATSPSMTRTEVWEAQRNEREVRAAQISVLVSRADDAAVSGKQTRMRVERSPSPNAGSVRDILALIPKEENSADEMAKDEINRPPQPPNARNSGTLSSRLQKGKSAVDFVAPPIEVEAVNSKPQQSEDTRTSKTKQNDTAPEDVRKSTRRSMRPRGKSIIEFIAPSEDEGDEEATTNGTSAVLGNEGDQKGEHTFALDAISATRENLTSLDEDANTHWTWTGA